MARSRTSQPRESLRRRDSTGSACPLTGLHTRPHSNAMGAAVRLHGDRRRRRDRRRDAVRTQAPGQPPPWRQAGTQHLEDTRGGLRCRRNQVWVQVVPEAAAQTRLPLIWHGVPQGSLIRSHRHLEERQCNHHQGLRASPGRA